MTKQKTKAFLMIGLIYLLIFQDWLQTKILFFRYFDELLALSFVPIFLFFLWKNKDRDWKDFIKENRAKFLIGICLFLLCILGLLANILFSYQPLFSALVDAFTFLKFYLVYFLFSMFLSQDFLERNRSSILLSIQIVTAFLFACVVASYLFPVFSTGSRFGIKTITIFYTHYTYLASVSIFLISLFLLLEKKFFSIYIFLNLCMLCSTLRFKSLAAACIILFLLGYIKFKRKRMDLLKLAVLGGLSILLVFSQIQVYFHGVKRSAREALLEESIHVANDHFPLGAGFATFGSHYSTKPYSPLYKKYGIWYINGLKENDTGYVSDSFWPIILGQIGYIGLILYGIIVLLLYSEVQKTKNKYLYAAKIIVFLYLIISSTSESAFFNPLAIPFAIILGVQPKEKAY